MHIIHFSIFFSAIDCSAPIIRQSPILKENVVFLGGGPNWGPAFVYCLQFPISPEPDIDFLSQSVKLRIKVRGGHMVAEYHLFELNYEIALDPRHCLFWGAAQLNNLM